MPTHRRNAAAEVARCRFARMPTRHPLCLNRPPWAVELLEVMCRSWACKGHLWSSEHNLSFVCTSTPHFQTRRNAPSPATRQATGHQEERRRRWSSDGQLRLQPLQRDRVQGEDVQPAGVHQQVLARPGWPQLPVDPAGPRGDVPVPLRAQPERRMTPLQILQESVSRRLAGQVLLVKSPGQQPSPGPLDDQARGVRPGLLLLIGG